MLVALSRSSYFDLPDPLISGRSTEGSSGIGRTSYAHQYSWAAPSIIAVIQNLSFDLGNPLVLFIVMRWEFLSPSASGSAAGVASDSRLSWLPVFVVAEVDCHVDS